MDAALQLEIAGQVDRLCKELDDRVIEHERVRPYAQRVPGLITIPPAVTAAKLTTAYRYLMAMAEMPWGDLVVSSKLDRLEPNGITSPVQSESDAVWEGVWQENGLGMESKLAHRAALQDGRSHATVWPESKWLDGGGADGATVQIDDCTTMIVEFEEGSRQRRVAALRRWSDEDDMTYITLYRRDGVYKFVGVKEADKGSDTFAAGGRRWGPRKVSAEAWPLKNPLGIVPVVELGVNRELAPGRFTVCRGEFANATGLMDRINLLTFLGLCLAVSMSFPLRILFGEVIRRDDEEKPIPPFDAYIGGVAQFENKDATIDEFKAADRSLLSTYTEMGELAAATSTPRHYFPVPGAMSNLAAETIRGFEGPLHAAVNGSHKPSLGEGWEEVQRIGGLMLPEPVKLSRRAELAWADHESRSLAERADAFSKLVASGPDGGGLPWQAAAELALGIGNDQIRRYESEMAGSALASLITAAREPLAPPPGPGDGSGLATAA